jgi:hypothetical protein
MTEVSTADDKRAQLIPQLTDIVMALTNPEVVELSALLDAMARRHGLTRKETNPMTTDPTESGAQVVKSWLDDDDVVLYDDATIGYGDARLTADQAHALGTALLLASSEARRLGGTR